MTTTSDQLHTPAAGDAPPRVELDVHPAPQSVFLFGFRWIVLSLVLECIGVAFFLWSPWAGTSALALWPIALFLVALLCAAVVRNSRRYELTALRVRASRGVFSRVSSEARLDHVRNITVGRSFLERVLGVGSIAMTTAGVGPVVLWKHVARPMELEAALRRAMDAAHPAADATSSPVQPIHPAMPGPVRSFRSSSRGLPVIGLAGGIGSGKSTVGRAFERLGCLVIDSDARAKAALDRPDVRSTLVGWWGNDVLAPDGRVDRAKVASIIFSDATERNKLEQLVHPIVREDRAAMIREAIAAGAAGVVVDAPLLFEAGVDAECDAVVFVEAPRSERLRRVQESRGWNEQELARREASQLPLEEKRRRSAFIVENLGNADEIDAQVSTILVRMGGKS